MRQLLLVSSGGLAVNLWGMYATGGHHHGHSHDHEEDVSGSLPPLCFESLAHNDDRSIESLARRSSSLGRSFTQYEGGLSGESIEFHLFYNTDNCLLVLPLNPVPNHQHVMAVSFSSPRVCRPHRH